MSSSGSLGGRRDHCLLVPAGVKVQAENGGQQRAKRT